LPGLPGKKADMPPHILEKRAATNPIRENGRDSSPLVSETRKKTVLAAAPDAKRAGWDARLTRLFNFQAASEGRMGFGGVPANPPLSLQAIRNDPCFWTAEICRMAAENRGDDVQGICRKTCLDVVRRSAVLIRPVYIDQGKGGTASSGHTEMFAGNLVCTRPPGCTAPLMQAGDRLPAFDPCAIAGAPPAGVIARLRQLPRFRQARDFSGMKPQERSSFGAFAATAGGFAAAARKTVDCVARALEGARSRAA